jgi:hypothetical protein
MIVRDRPITRGNHRCSRVPEVPFEDGSERVAEPAVWDTQTVVR